MSGDTLKETTFLRVPYGTNRQARIAAEERGMDVDDLLRALLLNGLNRLTGRKGVGAPELPKKRIRALEEELHREKKSAAQEAKARRAAAGEIERLAREVRSRLGAIEAKVREIAGAESPSRAISTLRGGYDHGLPTSAAAEGKRLGHRSAGASGASGGAPNRDD